MDYTILYFMGLHVEITKLCCNPVMKICFNLINSANPDDLLHYLTFYRKFDKQSHKNKMNISMLTVSIYMG